MNAGAARCKIGVGAFDAPRLLAAGDASRLFTRQTEESRRRRPGHASSFIRAIVQHGLAPPAAGVARLLLDRGCDPPTAWFERAAILGGLVRAGEPNTLDEAIARFLTEDASPTMSTAYRSACSGGWHSNWTPSY